MEHNEKMQTYHFLSFLMLCCFLDSAVVTAVVSLVVWPYIVQAIGSCDCTLCALKQTHFSTKQTFSLPPSFSPCAYLAPMLLHASNEPQPCQYRSCTELKRLLGEQRGERRQQGERETGGRGEPAMCNVP